MLTILRPLAFCCCMLWWCAMPCSVVAQEEVEWLVKPEFDDAWNFSEGMARVKQDGKWGFIDKTSKIVIQPQFDDVQDFSEGLAPVQQNYKWGFINKSGKMVIQPQFDDVWGTHYDDDFYFLEGIIIVQKDDKWGFIEKTGKIIVQPQFDYVVNFSEGMARVQKDDKWGFIEKTGKIIVQPQFDYVSDFSEGLARVQQNGKWGFVDKTGKFIIQLQFDGIQDFSKGVARVEKNGKWGLIDKSGKFIIQPQFDDVQDFSEGVAGVKKNDTWGFIDKSGKFIIQPQFDAVWDFSKGVAIAKKNDTLSFVDRKGNIISTQFNLESDFSEGMAIISEANNDKQGFIDETGKIFIQPQFEVILGDINSFNEGFAAVKLNGKYGFIKNPLLKPKPTGFIATSWIQIKNKPIDEIDLKRIVTDSQYIAIKVQAMSNSPLALTDFTVYNNGKIMGVGEKFNRVTLKNKVYSASVPLQVGENILTVQVRNASGTATTEEAHVFYDETKPTVYALAIGPKSIDLQFPEKDATDFRQFIANTGVQLPKRIRSVIAYPPIVGEKATAAAISGQIESLSGEHIQERDILFLHISTHGFLDNNKLYLQGAKYDPATPLSSSVDFDKIADFLAPIKCKKIIFLDACYSRGAKSNPADWEAARKAWYNKINGVVIFTSSENKSYEAEKWNNGAFTKVLIEGLSGGANTDGNDYISIKELDTYMSRHVPMLVKTINQLQEPKVTRNTFAVDMPVWWVR